MSRVALVFAVFALATSSFAQQSSYAKDGSAHSSPATTATYTDVAVRSERPAPPQRDTDSLDNDWIYGRLRQINAEEAHLRKLLQASDKHLQSTDDPAKLAVLTNVQRDWESGLARRKVERRLLTGVLAERQKYQNATEVTATASLK